MLSLKSAFLILYVFSYSILLAQVPSTKWAFNLAPSGDLSVKATTIDGFGNIWIAGSIDYPFDFDPDTSVFELSPLADEAAVVAKYDSNGQFLWAGMFDSSPSWSYDDHYSTAIETDASGNVYVAGLFNGTVDFNPDTSSSATFLMSGVTSTGNVENDMFLVKLTNAGSFIWAKKIAGTGFVECNDIVLDDNNNIYCTGNLDGSADFNPSSSTYNLSGGWGEGIFTAKYSSSGSFIWATVFQGDYRVNSQVIDLDPDGNILLGGWFEEDCSFGGIILDAGWWDRWGFVCKMTNSGSVIYAKPYTSGDGLYITGLKCDTLGNVNLAGYFEEGADLDPDTGFYNVTTPNNHHAMFFTQLDSTGLLNYVNVIRTTQLAYNYSGLVAIDENQDFYLSTMVVDTVILETQLGTVFQQFEVGSTNTDYIFKFDHSGNLIWSFGYPDQSIYSYQNLIHVDNSDNILFYSKIINGNNVDAHPGQAEYIVPKAGQYYGDVFFHNIGQGANTQMTFADTACNYYSFLGDTLDSTGVYSKYILNSQGCDSAITLNLILDYSPIISDTILACDSFLFSGNYLTLAGTYYDTLTANTGCDTTHILDLTIQPTYYTSYSMSVCDSQLLGNLTYFQSVIYVDSSLSQYGCDSVTQIDVTINYSSDTTVFDTLCYGYRISGTSIYYSNSGLYEFTIPKANGCDSNITLYFTRFYETYSLDTVTGCSPFTFNGQVYTNSNYVTQTFVNSVGCDSFATTFLELTQPVITQQSVESCGPFVYFGDTLTFSNSFSYWYTGSAGCDSGHVVNLSITNIDTSLNVYQGYIESRQTGAQYRWLDCTNNFAPLPNQWNREIAGPVSDVAVKITLNGCIDTSRCASTVPFGGQVGIIGTNMIGDGITVYPNPTRDRLFIDAPNPLNNELLQLIVFNSEGKIVLEKTKFEVKDLQIEVRALNSGIYFLKIVGRNQSYGASFSVSR